jgi:hypothetical protein
MKRTSRKPSKLSKSVQHQLNSYALAASAAGVGILALAQPSEAKIVYTQAHRVLKGKVSYKLDLNHDGITDFTLRESPCRSCGGGTVLSVLPVSRNGVSGFTTKYRSGWAFALKPGTLIGTRQQFLGRLMAWAGTSGDGGTDDVGSWVNVKNRYLGLKFKIAETTHYGWARLSVKAGVRTITATLTGYAYETIPNKPIIAGKTHGKDVITIEPASLGHLAQGASAIPAWRSKESQ